MMDENKIIQCKTHEQLLNQKGIYADPWQRQNGGYIGGYIVNDSDEKSGN